MKITEHVKEAESMGLVGDSQEVRLALIEKLNSGLFSLEDVKLELKKIQIKSHKEGLLIRSDFTKNKVYDLEMVRNISINIRHKNLSSKLKIKNSSIKIVKI